MQMMYGQVQMKRWGLVPRHIVPRRERHRHRPRLDTTPLIFYTTCTILLNHVCMLVWMCVNKSFSRFQNLAIRNSTSKKRLKTEIVAAAAWDSQTPVGHLFDRRTRYVPSKGRGICGGSHLILQHSPRISRQWRKRDRQLILVTNWGALITVWRRHGRRQDTRRVTARPAQSRDIARRPPALSRHAAVPTRADGMGAVPMPASGCGGATAPCHYRQPSPPPPYCLLQSTDSDKPREHFFRSPSIKYYAGTQGTQVIRWL